MTSGTATEEKPGKLQGKIRKPGNVFPPGLHLVEALVHVLSDDERNILSLRYLERMSFREISSATDLPLERVIRLHSNAISFIKARINHSAIRAGSPSGKV